MSVYSPRGRRHNSPRGPQGEKYWSVGECRTAAGFWLRQVSSTTPRLQKGGPGAAGGGQQHGENHGTNQQPESISQLTSSQESVQYMDPIIKNENKSMDHKNKCKKEKAEEEK